MVIEFAIHYTACTATNEEPRRSEREVVEENGETGAGARSAILRYDRRFARVLPDLAG